MAAAFDGVAAMRACNSALAFSRWSWLRSSTANVMRSLSAKCSSSSAALAIGTTGRGIGPAYIDKVARAEADRIMQRQE